MVLVVDANVLIDYAKTDDSVLALVAQHVGPVYIPRDVFDEVEQLDEEACARLGLVVVDGTLEQLLEAGETAGSLSFADRMCLILARDHGWVCVTWGAPEFPWTPDKHSQESPRCPSPTAAASRPSASVKPSSASSVVRSWTLSPANWG